MPREFRTTPLAKHDLFVTVGPFVLVALALFALAYWILDPSPPRRVVLATGVEGGAYAEFGKRYAKLLKADGIKVELRSTQGSAENLRLLRDPVSGVDFAFVQGGADRVFETPEAASAGLVSLGSLFYEPVWVFYREDADRRLLKGQPFESLSQLPGWRINVGAQGSGVAVLMDKLIAANDLDASQLSRMRLPQAEAVTDLLAGRLDALVLVSAPESPTVQELLHAPGIRLLDFAQADGYSRRFPFMSAVTLPRGVIDLGRDMPPHDVHLVAPTGTLVARESTHPALVQLFVQAAKEVHGGAGWFQSAGAFPNPRNTEQPLAAEAERFYRSGVPFLQRYLPFWLANLFERMWPVLAALVAVLIPLSRMLPPLYEFRIRSRVFRWYGQLRTLEGKLGTHDPAELGRELDALEQRVERTTVPLSYFDELYALRTHISLVRSRLKAMAAQGAPG
jgi:TRAP transporter TAXI family solute receptor